MACRFKLPRAMAILMSLVLAAGLLGSVSLLMARSIGAFAAHADQYSERAQTLLEALLNATTRFDLGMPEALSGTNRTTMQKAVTELAKSKDLNLSALSS